MQLYETVAKWECVPKYQNLIAFITGYPTNYFSLVSWVNHGKSVVYQRHVGACINKLWRIMKLFPTYTRHSMAACCKDAVYNCVWRLLGVLYKILALNPTVIDP